jgi:hypothetical protein
MSRGDDDPEERERVYSRIAPIILQFKAEHSTSTFHVEDLREYVRRCVPEIAPDSPGRILRELRLQRLLDYVVINRRQSLYQFRVLSEPEPMLTKTQTTFNVSQSKVQQWRRCRLQFHFANVRNLAPRVKARPLYFGTVVHKMLEATANGKDDRAALAEIAHTDEKLFRDELETFNRMIEDISFIMRAYKKFWSDQPLHFTAINGRNAEIPFEVKIDDGISCKGTIDGLVQHKKMHWLLENKTHREFPNDDHRWSNIQGAVYVTVAKLLGWPAKVKQLQGVCWNYIRSKEPTRPKLLKDNKLSQAANCDTLPEVVLDVLEEHKLNPKHYANYLALQESNLGTWFQRVFQPVQLDVVTKLWDEFLVTAREMADYYDHTDKPPPRTIDLHCKWCPFEKICRAELQGLDVDWVIEKEYVTKEGEYA